MLALEQTADETTVRQLKTVHSKQHTKHDILTRNTEVSLKQRE